MLYVFLPQPSLLPQRSARNIHCFATEVTPYIRKMKIKMKMTQKVTMKQFERRRKRLPFWKSAGIFFFATLLAFGIFVAFGTQCNAQEAPNPDASGVATGNKTAAVYGAGNPFVRVEPTDIAAPDYPINKKAFGDFQAQSAK